jgi:ribonuclease BN (tRNA processing enzyme)
MIFRQHYSSSAGNLYTLDMINERVLIDPGVSLGKIRQCGITMAGRSVWRSHDHQDHCAAYETLQTKMVLPVSAPCETWQMQHDVPCHAAMWREQKTGESIVFAIDTGNYEALPSLACTIYALECNYQDEHLELNYETLRVRQNHASLDQVIAYLDRCDLSRAQEIHLLHLSRRHADPCACVRAIRRRFAIPAKIKE